MSYYFRLYNSGEIYECPIQNNNSVISVGSGTEDNIIVSNTLLPKDAFKVGATENHWRIYPSSRKMHLDSELINTAHSLEHTVSLIPGGHVYCTVYRIGESTHEVNISNQSGLVIGRSSACDVSVKCRQVSARHCRVTLDDGQMRVVDLNSTNGTYVNGKKIAACDLKPGDVITIGFCKMFIGKSSISISYAGEVVISTPSSKVEYCISNSEEQYPLVYKPSPRLVEELPSEQIELQQPPAIGGKPEISWLNILLAPALTICVMLVISLTLLKSMNMLYFMIPTTLISAIMSVLRYRSEKNKHIQKQNLRFEKYGEYLNDQIQILTKLEEKQRRILNSVNPSSDACVRIATQMERSLWDRRLSDRDFLTLRLGLGNVSSSFSIIAPKQQFSLAPDDLEAKTRQIAQEYKFVSDCPITVSLKEHPTCGIIGSRASMLTLAKNLIVQAAVHQSYSDLRIVLIVDKEEWSEWSFARWLPHVFDDSRAVRYIGDTVPTAKKLLDSLYEVLCQRSTENARNEFGIKIAHRPFFLFVCSAPELIINHKIMKFLASPEQAVGCASLFLFDSLDNLPQECHYIIDLSGKTGTLYESDNVSACAQFAVDTVGFGGYDTFARSLAPIRTTSCSKTELPTNVSFLQGYNAKFPAMLQIEQNWANPTPEVSMSVAIGAKSDGSQFCFDINEKASGPHGLVAGMTGSGKSEMVQTWILAMAAKFPPSSVSFVLIDFKGTGLLLPFKNLPHLAGAISDLDTSISGNLIALQYELTRRKELLDRHGVSNISSYLKLLRSGQVSEPLPYLFIVIDEFAEFKLRFPDFMSAVNSVFAVGRTLGVQIILLTQKPSGVVDDKMQANMRFRWCLKVASSSDSKDMIGHTDAARITNPGRAYVRVGEDEIFEEIQSFWCGAPYSPGLDLKRQRLNKVFVVDIYGNRVCYEPEKTTGYRSDKSEIDAVVNYLDLYVRKNNIPRARAIWMPALRDEVYLKELIQIAFDGENWAVPEDVPSLRPAVGQIDDPRSQSQYPLYLNLSEQGNAVIYGAQGSGKTTFLHTVIMSMALMYAPSLVNMYLLDFAGGSLSLFANLPHVGGVAIGGREDEKVTKLIELLEREMSRRKALVSATGGMSNVVSYMEATGEKLPYIVLIVDNFNPALELYPHLELPFRRLCSDGPACGMYVIMTATGINGVSYRISQYMNIGISLRLKDRGDYMSVVGPTNGLEPKNVPGRGLVRIGNALEFQTALPSDGGSESLRTKNIVHLTSLMNAKWCGTRPVGIPVMPDVIRANDCPEKGVVLGLKYSDISCCSIDFKNDPFFAVSSCVNDNIYDLILNQLPERMNIGSVIRYRSSNVSTDAERFDRDIAALMPILQARKENFEKSQRKAEGEQSLVIAIDDFGNCFSKVSNETMFRLNNVVTLGAELDVILLIRSSPDELAKLYHSDKFTLNFIKRSNALLVGGNLQRHSIFSANLFGSERDASLEAGSAYYVKGGVAEKIKLIQE